MKRKTSRKKLIEKLDKIFSLYIRLRDNGVCYTCGKRGDIKQMQAGHYISRSCMALRWHEANVHCQCYSCNVCKHGDLITYRERLIDEFGEEYIIGMEKERHTTVKYKIEELQELIDIYQEELDKLQ